MKGRGRKGGRERGRENEREGGREEEREEGSGEVGSWFPAGARVGGDVRTPSSHSYEHNFVISFWHSMR